jgi:methyl-accepting chemotaxis protein
MKWLTNLKIGPRLLLGFAIVILLGVVSSFVSINSMSQVATISENLDLSNQTQFDATTLGNQRRDFVATGDTAYAEKAMASIATLNQLVSEQQSRNNSVEVSSLLTEMSANLADYEAAFEDVMDAEQSKEDAFDVWKQLGTEFDGIITNLKKNTEDNAIRLQEDTLETAFASMRVSAIYYIKMQDESTYSSLLSALETTVKENEALMSMVADNSELKALAGDVSDAVDEYTNQAVVYHNAVTSSDNAQAMLVEAASGVIGSTQSSSKYFGGAAQIEALANEAFAAQQSSARTTQIILSVVSAIGGIVAALLIMNSITKPLGKIVKAGDALAIGDLDNSSIDIESKDEVGNVADCFRNIITSQKEMAGSFEKMANGDLTIKYNARSDKDVIGIAFNKMLGDMRSLMTKLMGTSAGLTEAAKQLSRASEQAGQATQQIASTSQQVAKGASEQSSSLQNTTRAMEQLASAIEQISKGAQEQSKGVEKTLTNVKEVSASVVQVSSSARAASDAMTAAGAAAQKGEQKAQQTVGGMEKIKEAIGVASEKVTRLGEQSGEIDKIVATIDDIAAQTNLLALNAAIEAARAGEQGRGFAVVADEVRKLAERSLGATKEIADLIIGIQKGVSEAVKAMEDGNHEIESGYKLAADAGASLTEIVSQAEKVGRQVEQISGASTGLTKLSEELLKVAEEISSVVEENTAATEEMAASSDQVSKSVESVAGVAEENGAATEQVSASAQEMSAQVEQVVASAQSLSQMADELTQAVSVFKLDGKEMAYSRN